MGYKINLIGRKKVEILQRFDNSVLVKYVKTGIEACVNPKLIKTRDVTEFKKNSEQYRGKKTTKNNNNNNQLNFEL